MPNRRKPGVAKARNSKLSRLATDTGEKPSYYFCCSCGKHFPSMDRNFPKCHSELWAGRDYHLPICKDCIDRMYEHYLEFYDDERQALKRICMAFDIYYSDTIADASGNISKNRSRVLSYLQKTNINQYKEKSYDTTLDEERSVILAREHDLKRREDQDKIKTSVQERWGAGSSFTQEEYKILEDHYKMLKRNNPNIDNNQEIFIKDLCIINMMKMNAARDKDVDTYNKTSEQYSKIFSKAGLKTVEEKDKSMNDALGVTLAVISQYTPEEFYKNKKLFSDYDDLDDYYTRNILRPMQNIMTGTDIRDSEFYISDEDEEEVTDD